MKPLKGTFAAALIIFTLDYYQSAAQVIQGAQNEQFGNNNQVYTSTIIKATENQDVIDTILEQVENGNVTQFQSDLLLEENVFNINKPNNEETAFFQHEEINRTNETTPVHIVNTFLPDINADRFSEDTLQNKNKNDFQEQSRTDLGSSKEENNRQSHHVHGFHNFDHYPYHHHGHDNHEDQHQYNHSPPKVNPHYYPAGDNSHHSYHPHDHHPYDHHYEKPLSFHHHHDFPHVDQHKHEFIHHPKIPEVQNVTTTQENTTVLINEEVDNQGGLSVQEFQNGSVNTNVFDESGGQESQNNDMPMGEANNGGILEENNSTSTNLEEENNKTLTVIETNHKNKESHHHLNCEHPHHYPDGDHNHNHETHEHDYVHHWHDHHHTGKPPYFSHHHDFLHQHKDEHHTKIPTEVNSTVDKIETIETINKADNQGGFSVQESQNGSVNTNIFDANGGQESQNNGGSIDEGDSTSISEENNSNTTNFEQETNKTLTVIETDINKNKSDHHFDCHHLHHHSDGDDYHLHGAHKDNYPYQSHNYHPYHHHFGKPPYLHHHYDFAHHDQIILHADQQPHKIECLHHTEISTEQTITNDQENVTVALINEANNQGGLSVQESQNGNISSSIFDESGGQEPQNSGEAIDKSNNTSVLEANNSTSTSIEKENNKTISVIETEKQKNQSHQHHYHHHPHHYLENDYHNYHHDTHPYNYHSNSHDYPHHSHDYPHGSHDHHSHDSKGFYNHDQHQAPYDGFEHFPHPHYHHHFDSDSDSYRKGKLKDGLEGTAHKNYDSFGNNFNKDFYHLHNSRQHFPPNPHSEPPKYFESQGTFSDHHDFTYGNEKTEPFLSKKLK